MTDIAITVESLSKAYRIGRKEQVPDTLVGAAASWLKAPLSNLGRLRRLDTFSQNGEADDVVWALKDVSFEVSRGEVIGIIGRNGAGKSTLLKILSRITEPTSGRAVIRGRVSSLLEVGTGFHPELTGRENIYMNGTVLGMTKREIERKFDEIVDFSGVEAFLDTPVKRYSSGMTVRLAFAVAAHLEPETLVIDEVLAVGDVEFQNKCLGKMQDVARGGRTILFVSHNMAAVTNFCGRGILLANGTVRCVGSIQQTLDVYARTFSPIGRKSNTDLDTFRESWCTPVIKWARIAGADDGCSPAIPLGGPLTVELVFDTGVGLPLRSPVMGLVFRHAMKGTIAGINTRMTGFSAVGEVHRSGTFRCTIPKLPFLQGAYTIDLWLGDRNTDVDVLKEYLHFTIAPTDYYGTGTSPFEQMGTVFLDAVWSL